MRCISATTYRLSLDVDPGSLGYHGSVEVLLDAPVRELRLNSVDLQIDTAEVAGSSVPFQLLPASQELHLGPFPAPSTAVTVRFRGKVSKDSLSGFYRSRHGASGSFLTTHLAPTGARRVFPCVDHPASKAVFEVEVGAPADDEVLFNTDPREVTSLDHKRIWRFAPTPKMSTYLVYFGVGKFDSLVSEQEGLRVTVKTPPGQKDSAPWALENGHKSVAAYASYYGIPYPLPKLDLVSVHDFAAGAMENWGAITFRESYLLTNPSTSTFLRQVIAEVIAHEIAHQWFGNLVTMKWWNDIWLNESFATLMSFKMVDRFYPDWDILGQFLVSQTGGALSGDALASTHPIDVAVKEAEEVNQIFDEISYGKGASVLRMFEAFLGEEAFRAGVGAYLRAHAYGNAEGKDLWAALEKASGAPVQRTIHPWIARGGHPVVLVHREGDRVRLSQKGYRLDGRHTPESWPIPIVLRTGGETTRVLFDGPTLELPAPRGTPLNLNAGSVGFYRVLYDPESYELLRSHPRELSARERWSIVRDLYSFLHSGETTPAQYIAFLGDLTQETDPMIIVEVAGELQNLHAVLGEDSPIVREGAKFLRAQALRLGVARREGEPNPDGVARDACTSALAWMDAEFARELAPRFRDWALTDPDVKRAACIAYARTEGPHAFDPLVARARAATNEAEMEQTLWGLTAFQDPALVARTLQWALGGDVTRGLLSSLGIYASYNPRSREVLWSWFLRNLETLEKVYVGTAMMGSMVEDVIARAGLGNERAVREALSRRPIAECDRATQKGLEMLAIRERMRARLAREASRSPSAAVRA